MALIAGLAASMMAGTSRGSVALVQRLDGEQLFRGLIFGSGPIAQEVYGESAPVDISPSAKPTRVEKRLLRAIGDQRYYERFGRKIQSGDHVLIDQALLDGATRLSDALSGMVEKRASVDELIEERNVHPLDNYTNGVYSYQDVYSNIAYYSDTHLAVDLAWIIQTYTVLEKVLDPHADNGGTRLERDRLVDRIARTLRAYE